MKRSVDDDGYEFVSLFPYHDKRAVRNEANVCEVPRVMRS